MGHLVSIIMPAYNAAKYIPDAIRSVLAQTCAGWELLVVDDGSTDDTAEVVRGFASADGRIKYLRRENGGQGKARNTGLEKAGGDLIAFLDADDLWVSDKLERQIATLEQTGADVVYSDGYIFSGDDAGDETDSFSSLYPKYVIYGKFDGDVMFRHLFVENRIPILSVLARRGVMGEARLFTEEPECQNCEDYDLWLKLARRGAVFYGMTDRLVRYRRHPDSATHLRSNQLRPMVAVVRRHADDARLGERVVRERLRGLYRALVSALVEEGRVAEARESMREFSAWDGRAVVTSLQSIIINLMPGKYNFISRECLYRAEWHIGRVLGRRAA